MQKLAVNEAAEILGITKEAVYNRIRRGSLKTVIENGTKFVILDEEPSSEKPTKTAPKSTKTKSQNDEFVSYLLNELNELKSLNLNLQADKDRLFREKEQILLNNKIEIAQIYRERDEKLRGFLSMLERPLLARQNGEYVAPIDVEFVESKPENEGKWTSLAEFLKSQNLSGKSLKKTQNKIIKNIGKSKFIKFKKGVIMVKSKKILKELDKK